MGKQIIFTYKDREYKLEFNRRAVQRMEEQGFVASAIGDKPATMLPKLFAGAFIMHHPYVHPELVSEIYGKLPNKEALIEELSEMYAEPITSLLEDPKDQEGKVDWKVL